MVDEPAAVPNKQQASEGSSLRKMERGGHCTSSSDSDSDSNIANLI